MKQSTFVPVAAHQWPPVVRQIWRILGSVDIRTKILGIVLLVTIGLGLAITWQVRTVMKTVFASELENRGLSVASDLAARSVEPILLNDGYALYQLLLETVTNHPDARYAFVQGNDGEILAHTFGRDGFPSALLDIDFTEETKLHGDSGIRHLRYESAEGVIHEFAAPIFAGQAAVVRLGLGETRLTNIVNTTTGQLLLTTLLVALVGIGAAFGLTWVLTRPILDLVATVEAVAQGNLEVRAPHWADDEVGTLADAFNQLVADLAASQRTVADKEQARTLLLQKLIHAQEEERRRIARELHDGVGQVLTSLVVGNQMAAHMESLSAIQAKNQAMADIAGETLRDVRLLSRQLRPSILDDLGLHAALERYAEEFGTLYPTLDVDLQCDLSERLPGVVEISLYRIIQEAMTNAARHSQATTLGVLVRKRDRGIQAIIEDNGQGFDPQMARQRGSVGIHAMIERAELLGGRLDIESSDAGSTIFAEIPA